MKWTRWFKCLFCLLPNSQKKGNTLTWQGNNMQTSFSRKPSHKPVANAKGPFFFARGVLRAKHALCLPPGTYGSAFGCGWGFPHRFHGGEAAWKRKALGTSFGWLVLLPKGLLGIWPTGKWIGIGLVGCWVPIVKLAAGPYFCSQWTCCKHFASLQRCFLCKGTRTKSATGPSRGKARGCFGQQGRPSSWLVECLAYVGWLIGWLVGWWLGPEVRFGCFDMLVSAWLWREELWEEEPVVCW